MEEQHGFVVGTEPWLAVPEHPGACGAQPIAGGDDVVDLVAEVVHTAVGVALEKAAHWRIYAERLEQLDPRVRQFDEHHRYAMRRQGRVREKAHGWNRGARQACSGAAVRRHGDARRGTHTSPVPRWRAGSGPRSGAETPCEQFWHRCATPH